MLWPKAKVHVAVCGAAIKMIAFRVLQAIKNNCTNFAAMIIKIHETLLLLMEHFKCFYIFEYFENDMSTIFIIPFVCIYTI